MIMFMGGFCIGLVVGAGLMCILQIAKDDEE